MELEKICMARNVKQITGKYLYKKSSQLYMIICFTYLARRNMYEKMCNMQLMKSIE